MSIFWRKWWERGVSVSCAEYILLFTTVHLSHDCQWPDTQALDIRHHLLVNLNGLWRPSALSAGIIGVYHRTQLLTFPNQDAGTSPGNAW